MKYFLKFVLNAVIGAFVVCFVLPNINGINVTSGFWTMLLISLLLFCISLLFSIAGGLLALSVGLVRKGDSKDRIMTVMAVPAIFIQAGAIALVARWFPGEISVETWTAALVAALIFAGVGSITTRLLDGIFAA